MTLHHCAGLRAVAHALLTGTGSSTLKVGNGPHAGEETVASLSYLRDRVGVPRDLPLPAARQLRAHLNWAIHSLQVIET
jgi:glutathione S-transferase